MYSAIAVVRPTHSSCRQKYDQSSTGVGTVSHRVIRAVNTITRRNATNRYQVRVLYLSFCRSRWHSAARRRRGRTHGRDLSWANQTRTISPQIFCRCSRRPLPYCDFVRCWRSTLCLTNCCVTSHWVPFVVYFVLI